VATFLESVVERTQADLARRKRATPRADLEARLGPARRERPFSEALIDEGISLIAEMKRASPSRGPIRPGASVAEIVTAYQDAGARAVSVLTESAHFGGSLDDLAEARAACDLPLLRKDFVIDPYQVLEARAAGADAVLLIVAILEPALLRDLAAAAKGLGLAALVECHTRAELEVALAAGSALVGINNRDLTTFETRIDTTVALMPHVPPGPIVVSESGFFTGADVRRVVDAGAHAILVGEGLVRAHDVPAKIRELKAA
jgi:indole-3-glycerol phosphate synthase